jgi:hypothetical protein
MRTYQDVWNEYNRVYSASADSNRYKAALPWDRHKLIALCNEMQEILTAPHHKRLWAWRAELHRTERDGEAFAG